MALKKRTLVFVASIWLIGVTTLSFAQTSNLSELRAAIDQSIVEGDMPNAWWTVKIVEAETGMPWYEKDTGRSFIPASNTKLFTTAAALEILGPDFSYETSIWSDGWVEDGVLKGNLIVRGSGDPVIGGRFNDGDITEAFRAWADSLKALGVTRISGNIVGDDNAFDEIHLGEGWEWDDLTFWYGAEISALSFNDNCVDFRLIAQKEKMPAELAWEPANTSYVSAVNASLTVAEDHSITEGYFREQGSNRFTFSSLVPQGRTDYESLAVSNPTAFFVHVLRETLVAQGISVGGSSVDIDTTPFSPSYSSLNHLFSHFSPPLSEIVRVINKRSQNLYAEQVLRTIAVNAPLAGSGLIPGSAAMGISRSKEVYGKAGIDTLRIQLVDGSGLSRHNLITTTMMTNLLRYMRHHPDPSVRSAFLESMSIAGVDGDVRTRMRGTSAEGNARAKSGTVGNASALSGFVTTSDGTELIFSIISNHHTVPATRPRQIQNEIVSLLASHSRK